MSGEDDSEAKVIVRTENQHPIVVLHKFSFFLLRKLSITEHKAESL